MKLRWILLAAFAAMCANDIAMTIMVIEEARLSAVMAGLFDIAGWITSLVCSALAIESIIRNGWRSRRSLAIIAVVSCANFMGTVAGVTIGSAIIHH